MEGKQLICGHCLYGGDPPPLQCTFFLNTRITKSCGLNGGGGGAVDVASPQRA